MITFIALVTIPDIKLSEVIADLSSVEKKYNARLTQVSQGVHLITLAIDEEGCSDVAFQLHNEFVLSDSLVSLGTYVDYNGTPIELM